MIYAVPREPPTGSILYDSLGNEWHRTGKSDGWGNWCMEEHKDDDEPPIYAVSWQKLLHEYGPLFDDAKEL